MVFRSNIFTEWECIIHKTLPYVHYTRYIYFVVAVNVKTSISLILALIRQSIHQRDVKCHICSYQSHRNKYRTHTDAQYFSFEYLFEMPTFHREPMSNYHKTVLSSNTNICTFLHTKYQMLALKLSAVL